jgi:pimeloyl-ACP methyl ester carboxylesterase
MRTRPARGVFFKMNFSYKLGLVLLTVVLTGCVAVSKKPDLEALYSTAYMNETGAPLIVIPGIMGSTLVDASGKEVWPVSVNNLAFTRYDELMPNATDGVRAGRLFDEMAGIDFYGNLVSVLESAGKYRQASLGQTVADKSQRRLYVFTYDWRKSNFEAVDGLHALIEQIRRDYRDPGLKVDIIAHSNGGLISRYYLQYGPQSVDKRPAPKPWSDGGQRIRRLVMLGTPNLGSIISVKRLYQGYDMGLRTVPADIMAHFATPFETLPLPGTVALIDANGTPVPLDLYDIGLWEQNRWSVFSVETEARMNTRALAAAQAVFRNNLKQARHFQAALAIPMVDTSAEVALFGGDCNQTESRAVLEGARGSYHLAFSEEKIKSRRQNVNYQGLLSAAGDGLVTRESASARKAFDYLSTAPRQELFPVAQTTFFCERHSLLTGNPFFQNNLLYFIFH